MKKLFAALVILAALAAGNLAISQTNTQGTGTQRLSAAGGAGGGGGTDATVTFTDITTNNVSITKHGFAPKAPNDATQFLNGVGGYSVPGALGGFLKADGTVSMTSNLNGGGNNLINFAGITAGALVLDSAVAIATPPTGDIGLGTGSFASAPVPIWKDPSAVTYAMQTALWRGNFAVFMNGFSTTTSFLGGGIGKSSGGGIVTHPTPATTSPTKYFSAHRAVITAATGIINQGGVTGVAADSLEFWRGNAANQGGFFFESLSGIEVWASTDRYFNGLVGTISSSVSGEPSVLAVGIFALAMDSTDSVIKLFTRDGSTTTTKIPLAGVASVAITGGGSGCTTAPALSFSGGGGGGAAGYTTIAGGAVTSATITTVGGAFTSTPTPVFTGGGCSGVTGTATLTSMPAPVVGTGSPVFLDVYIYAKPNDSTIYYRVDDVIAGVTVVDYSATTNIPLTTQFLTPNVNVGSGPTNSGAGVAAASIVRVWCSAPPL